MGPWVQQIVPGRELHDTPCLLVEVGVAGDWTPSVAVGPGACGSVSDRSGGNRSVVMYRCAWDGVCSVVERAWPQDERVDGLLRSLVGADIQEVCRLTTGESRVLPLMTDSMLVQGLVGEMRFTHVGERP